jgi:hypothetical protein
MLEWSLMQPWLKSNCKPIYIALRAGIWHKAGPNLK